MAESANGMMLVFIGQRKNLRGAERRAGNVCMGCCGDTVVYPLTLRTKQLADKMDEFWQQHADTLRHFYWSGHEIFWTKGYFVSSIGNVSQETIQHYIENQC